VIDMLQEDVRAAPTAFHWRGSVERNRLIEWLGRNQRTVPDELILLWTLTGGGDMFETEELLCPMAAGEHDLELVNTRMRASGLSADFLVFHIGLHVTAVQTDGQLAKVDAERLSQTGGFESLADWYLDLRREYGKAYGLPPR
jgi:hypothetical protein